MAPTLPSGDKQQKAAKRVSWDSCVVNPKPRRTCQDCGHQRMRKPRRQFSVCTDCYAPLCSGCVFGEDPLCKYCLYMTIYEGDEVPWAEYDFNKSMLVYC